MPPINPVDGHHDYVVKPNHYLIVARIRFPLQAGDKLGGGLVRMGPANVRLVAPGISSTTGEPLDHVDYYPIGTLQYKGPHITLISTPLPTTLFKPVLMLQNADDYLFIKKDDPDPNSPTPDSGLDSGADFVFSVYKSALAKKPSGQMQVIDKPEDHPFIEIKRLVRENVGGRELLPEADLQKDKDSIAIIRRDKLLQDEMAKKNFYADPSEPSSTPTPSTPAPKPARAPRGLRGADHRRLPVGCGRCAKVYDRFYTSVTSDRDSGDLTIDFPGGAKVAMSVDNNQIHALTIDGATSTELRGTSEKHFINLAAPLNMTLVQVSGKLKTGAAVKPWSWKDQFNDLALVDASGARIGPPIGAWVQYSDGGTNKVSARFNTDGGATVDSIKPVGEVKQVWFVFAVPKGTKIAKVVNGQTNLIEQPVDVP